MSSPETAPKRQFVNFAYYKVDPAWRRLPEDERTRGKQEFIRAVEEYNGKVLVIAYTTVAFVATATSCCGESVTNWNCFKRWVRKFSPPVSANIYPCPTPIWP